MVYIIMAPIGYTCFPFHIHGDGESADPPFKELSYDAVQLSQLVNYYNIKKLKSKQFQICTDTHVMRIINLILDNFF